MNVLDKKICKFEQISNWNKRPLRKSQTHYAAVEAFALIKILEKLKEKASKEGYPDVEKFIENIEIVES